MIFYKTYFELEYPVRDEDFEDAKHYLQEEDMTKFLKDYSGISFPEKIESIKWFLTGTDDGYVLLETNQKLDDKELKKISEWVKGQNSDGLGEGFEQHFEYEDREGLDEDDEEEGFWCTPSFDWKSNDYVFEEERD